MATEQTNIPVVGIKTAIACIIASYGSKGKHPLILWGPPGVGKSAAVYQAAAAIGGEVVDFRLVTTEPVDLRGYPVVLKDDAGNPTGMAWVPADLLPKGGKGILFLDELPQAPTMNMNAAAELVYDRRLGNDYTLPEGWMVVAAGNRRLDRAGTIEMPTHMKNRLVHLEVDAKVEDWIEWAEGPGSIHPDVVGYVRTNPRLFNAFSADALAFPTSRTWEVASDFCMNDSLPAEVRRALIAGAIGKGAGIELEAYRDRGKGLPRYEDIVADPKNAPVGSNESEAYALIAMVSRAVKVEHLDEIVTYFKRHRRENTRAAVHRIIKDNPDFLSHKEFQAFAVSVGQARA